MPGDNQHRFHVHPGLRVECLLKASAGNRHDAGFGIRETDLVLRLRTERAGRLRRSAIFCS
jgi:hypothetical protein